MKTRPPYNAFWSLTLYNSTDYFLINTTNNVYTLGSQFPNLEVNNEGGATLYLSQAAPSSTAMQRNWLPLGVAGAPAKGEFYALFRIYSPTSPNVVTEYVPPDILLADEKYAPISCNS